MMNEIVLNDKAQSRNSSDRRQDKLRSLYCSIFKRRRTQSRRDQEITQNSYVDVHEPFVFILFSITVLLSATDAMFTLFIINNGGEEINPFMRYLLEIDITAFFWVKFFLTSFGMLFLVSHKHFTFYEVVRGYHIMYAVFATYFILVSYEIYLISEIFKMS